MNILQRQLNDEKPKQKTYIALIKEVKKSKKKKTHLNTYVYQVFACHFIELLKEKKKKYDNTKTELVFMNIKLVEWS